MPHYSETYVNLQSSRTVLNYAQLGKKDRPDVEFVVIHYDQVSRYLVSFLEHLY